MSTEISRGPLETLRVADELENRTGLDPHLRAAACMQAAARPLADDHGADFGLTKRLACHRTVRGDTNLTPFQSAYGLRSGQPRADAIAGMCGQCGGDDMARRVGGGGSR